MPSGCEFLCDNVNCQNYGSGFTMHDFWPVASISDLLSHPPETGYPEGFVKAMEQRLHEGRKFGIVFYPLQEGIDLKGIRVQLWQQDPPTIIDEDIEVEGLSEEIEKKGEKVMDEIVTGMRMRREFKIRRDGYVLRTYRECFHGGIPCPSCGQVLSKRNWFTIHR
jgi:hypothetical protein